MSVRASHIGRQKDVYFLNTSAGHLWADDIGGAKLGIADWTICMRPISALQLIPMHKPFEHDYRHPKRRQVLERLQQLQQRSVQSWCPLGAGRQQVRKCSIVIRPLSDLVHSHGASDARHVQLISPSGLEERPEAATQGPQTTD